MTGPVKYRLTFYKPARKEWEKLDKGIRDQFTRKLEERLNSPRVPADRLHGSKLNDCYKIKLRSAGYRLVYQVIDDLLIITVISVGRRDKSEVYRRAENRLD